MQWLRPAHERITTMTISMRNGGGDVVTPILWVVFLRLHFKSSQRIRHAGTNEQATS